MSDNHGARRGSARVIALEAVPPRGTWEAAARVDRGHARGSDEQNRIASIQILRFIAAFSVCLYHLIEVSYRGWGFTSNPFTRGSYGVDIFFVISGFVIALSVRRHRAPAEFFLRRAARVVPLYWFLTIVIAAIAIAAPQLLKTTSFSFEDLLTSLFFIPHARPNGAVQPMLIVGWSLNYEMFFYTVFALSLFAKSWSPIYPCAAIASLVAAGLVFPSGNVAWNFYTNPIVLEFIFGVGIYQMWAAGHLRESQLSGFVLLGMLMMSLALFVADGIVPRVVGPGLGAAALVLAALGYRAPDNAAARILGALGGASYSLYLIHPYVIGVFVAVLISKTSSIPFLILECGAALAASVAASLVLYHWVEKPSQKFLLQRLTSR